MKLRIKGNSIRLRLTQCEVKQLDKKGMVQSTTQFSAQKTLIYKIVSVDTQSINVDFDNNQLVVSLPKNHIATWANTEITSISRNIDNMNDDGLKILVEKDFKCLIPRISEDEQNLFDNPLAAKL